MFINYIITLASDIVLVLSSILLIRSLGISQKLILKRVIYAVILIICVSSAIFVSFEYNYSALPVLLYPLMFLCSYKIVFGRICFAQIYVALCEELIITLLSLFGTLVIYNANSFSYVFSEKISFFIVRIIFLVIAWILNHRTEVKKIYTSSKVIPKHIFILAMVVFVFIDALAAFNIFPQNSELKQNIMTGLILVLAVCLIVMIFSLLINVASKNYYTALNTLLEKQVSAQIAHYEKLEKLSSDMRTFRHDYINHLSSISALITEGFYDDAQRYIDRLTESTHRNETIFRTGNRLADAILTDKSENCKAFADIVFDGCITDKIGNSDICIILANALDNAAEACKSCPERGRISIESQVRQGYWKMVMRNPTVGADSEGIMKTSKEDERNHGFGLLSIEQAVKRYDGTMSVSIKNGVFELAVVLKLPMEKPQ